MTVVSGWSDAAGRLESLAASCQRERQLRDLAGALRAYKSTPADVESARGWAGVDLFSAFLSEEPGRQETGRPAKFWSRIDVVVQVLVFVPILLTWIGLAVAAFVAKSGESLLQAWQTGNPSGLKFHWVAVYTALVVFLLIVVSAALILHNRSLEQRQARLRQDLAEALTTADLELTPLRIGITEHIAQELDQAADKLSEAAARIEAVGRTAVQTQQAATAAVAATLPALATVDSAARAAHDATAELGSLPGKLTGHLDMLGEAATEVARAERDLVAAGGASSRQLAAAVAASLARLTTASLGSVAQVAETAVNSSNEMAAASVASSRQIAGTFGGHADEIRAVLNEAAVAAASYASRTEAAFDILGRAEETMAELPDAVSGLRGGVSGVGGQLAELTTAITAAGEMAATLLAAITAVRGQSIEAGHVRH
jgi:hypothetical protein